MSKIDGDTVASVSDLTDDDSRDIYRQMGRGLKALHELTFPKFGYIPHTAPVEGWETNAEFMRAWFSRQLKQFEEHGGDPQLAQSMGQRVHASESLFAACTTATFCHNDLHEGNVLVAKNGNSWQITGFIDVGGAIAADPLFDVGRTDYWSTRGNPLKHEALLEGYGPMRPGWEAALQVYGLYHALELRNWFAREGDYPDMGRHIERDLKRLAAVGSDSNLPGKRPM
jgi:aminoglycoside phosphotransferase (APT) family kinase protein